MWARWTAVVLAFATGCSTLPAEFHCTTQAQCAGAGPNFDCEVGAGFCTFEDQSCTQGRRYHDSAGPFAGYCVGQTPDLSTGQIEDLAQPIQDLIGADLSNPVIVGNTVNILAGAIGGIGDHDDTGDLARLNQAIGAAADGAGNLYIADTRNFIIRKLDLATKQLSYYAGSRYSSGSVDGQRQAASFFNPTHMVRVGNILYFPDALSHTIRALDTSAAPLANAVSTFAGTAGVSGSTDNVAGAAARFNAPFGITSDGTALFVSEWGSHTIRKINIGTKLVTRIAGVVGSPGATNGALDTGKLNFPSGMAVISGALYIADRDNHQIRKLDLGTNTLSYVAGHTNATPGAETAAFNSPTGVVSDGNGNLFVADRYNRRIRSIALSSGTVTELVGNGANGNTDGSFAACSFRVASNIVALNATQYAVLDEYSQQVRLVDTAASTCSTLAGKATQDGNIDGSGSTARFSYPAGVAVAPSGEIYVADLNNNAIRKLTGTTPANIQVTTPLGSSHTGGNTDGRASSATFKQPSGLAFGNGKLFISDTGNCLIRVWDPSSGMVSTLAGGSARDCGATKTFKQPADLVYDAANDLLYVADSGFNAVYSVTSAGVVTLVAGQPTQSAGIIDGDGLNMARFGAPVGLALDGTTLYVADSNGPTVRAVDLSSASHNVTTLWGTKYVVGSSNGTGPAALMVMPHSLALDGRGTLYLTDSSAGVVRKLDIASKMSTNFIGTPVDSVIRTSAPALINSPAGLAIHPLFGLVTVSLQENVVLSMP